jgi:hypothetical protein
MGNQRNNRLEFVLPNSEIFRCALDNDRLNTAIRLFGPVILLVFLFAALAGCGESTTTTPSPEPDYARAITETTLQGLSDSNLEAYTRHGTAEFKAAVTQEILDATAGPLKEQYGAYESLEYLYTEQQDQYTIVHYRVKYARGELGVRMVFDRDHLVAGQWFE